MEGRDIDRGGYASDGSEEEYGPAPKRQRKHKFKTFKQRVNNVEVDVYRSLGPKRAEPLAGSTCFFQERLAAWRELNAAHDWLEAATELHSLCQSLPQLLHHQEDILEIILPKVNVEASLSLEPLLELLGALARDLQADFLPHMDRVLTVLSDFVDSGGDREPELLQHVFTCCSLLCKHLCKLLASDLTPILSQSARLRYHRAYHVRSLAAESFGFLLRHANSTAARAAVRTVLADAAIRPSVARVNGAGLLIAEAASGVSNGLHSRGTALLQLLLQEDILTENDFFKDNGSAHGDIHSHAATSPVLVGRKRRSTELKSKKSASTTLSLETISARIAAVAAQCLDRLLNHVRRGPAVLPLWEVVQAEVMSRVEAILETADEDQDDDLEGALFMKRSAARSVALLARMIEYHRGSRVESYAPLFDLATKLVSEKVLPGEDNKSSPGSSSDKKKTIKNKISKASRKEGDGQVNDEEPSSVEAQNQESAYSEFIQPSLSYQILRYLQSLVYSHCKIVSASEGPVAIQRAAPLWAGIFARAPQFEILNFIRALISPPAGAEVCRCFAPHMLAAVGRSLLSGEYTEVCWPLLMDLCDVLGGERNSVLLSSIPSGGGGGGGVVPIILTAGSGIGHKLSKLICTTVTSFKYSEKEKKEDRKRVIQVTWAALHCLQHAVAKSSQAAERIATLLASTTTALEKAVSSFSSSSSSGTKDEFENLLMLHCAARAAAAATGSSHAGDEQEQHMFTQDALKLVEAYPQHYHAVYAAAETLQRAAAKNTTNTSEELSSEAMLKLAPLLAANLAHPSTPLRVATLRVLCSFRQPESLPSSEDKATEAAGGKAATTLPVSDALPQLLFVHSRQLGADGGRPAIVSLGRVKTHLEFHHVPETLVPLVVRSLLGVLHIRFAPLWPAAGAALSMALDVYPSLAWPLIFEHLSIAQTAFLGGDYYTRPREEERTPLHFSANTTTNSAENGSGFEIAEIVLEDRFASARVQGSSESAGGSTDAAAQLTHILRALTTSNNNILEGKSKEWVALFLSFSSAKSPDGVGLQEEAEEGGEEEADDADEKDNASGVGAMEVYGDTITAVGTIPSQQQLSVVSPRAWRGALKEWLAMLSSLKGIRGTYKADHIQRAVASHCLDVDPAVQQAALKCLKAFKLQWLAPYLDRLLRLADNKTLRSELAAFPLGKRPTSVREGDDIEAILPEHRAALVPLLVALLFPKMRKRSGRLGGKGAPGSARAAILNFLAAAEATELRPLIELFLGPLGSVFSPPEGFIEETPTAAEAAMFGPGQGTWWGRELGKQTGFFWLDAINAEALNAQPLRRRVGYLNTLEDILKHLGHRMEPFLPELLALAVVLFEGGTTELMLSNNPSSGSGGVEETEKEEGGKEIRSRCLRLVATVMDRFPSSHDFSFLWPRLLSAAAPLMERIGVEAAADRPPPLVDICVALSTSQNLVGILADGSVIENEIKGAEDAGEGSFELVLSKETWAAEDHLGSRLLSRCIAALSCSTCAEPTRVAMLGALENIFDFVDPLPEILLGQHTPLLLSGLQSVVIAVWKQSSGAGIRFSSGPKSKLLSVGQRGGAGGSNKTAAPPKRVTATRALAILELVGGRASDWNTASQLTDAFLPLLSPQGGGRGGKRAADEELVARALGALTALWSRLGATANDTSSSKDQIQAQDHRLRQIATAAAPLAGSLNTRDARGALGAMLSAVASLLPEELHLAAELFVGLSSFSTTEIDEADYETRMAAYTQLNREIWAGLSSLAAAPLVQLCARDLRSLDDLALRHAAAQALSNLIDAAAKEVESDTSECVLLVQKQLFPQLKRSIGASSLAVRQEHLALIRHLALSLPEKYPDLEPLTHKEAEADFWLNAAHLQLHRRARAFTRLGRMLRDPDLPSISIGVLVGLIGPLLQQSIVEGRPSEDDAGHEAKQVDVDRGANVVDAAVHALGAVASVLPWVQYQQLLGQYLRLISKHSEGTASKAVLRAVCALLDAFHFLPAGGAEDEEEAAAAAAEDVEMLESEEMEAEKIVDKYALPPRAEVYRMLSKRVVPELRGQLVSGETVRAPVAQALVKVLKLLPSALMRSELPRTLQSVANLLKLRLQRLRDDARAVLVAMASDLGPEYLPFTLEVLRSALPDRGYTAHILGYTVHAVLEAVASAAAQEPGSLDDCLPMILPVIEKDLFGHTAEAKEVDAFAASYKEAKRCRANDTYQLMASLVTFSTHVPKLLAPVRDRLCHASHPKTRAKLGMLLQYASQGLLANATTTSRDLCELVYAISDAGLSAEEAAREKALGGSGVAIVSDAAGKKEKKSLTRGRMKTNISEAGDEARIALHQPLLVEFALTTFKAALRKGLVPTQGPEATALLDPLLPLLIRALKSRHSPSVTASLQALSLLIVQAELPGLDAASADAGKAVTDLLKRCPKTTDPVAQDCFKLLAGMLRRCERYAPSQAQLRFLLGWAFTDLEESAQRQTAFTLLRAILARKLVLPEVYDLMERVQELMVRSQSKQVRQLASNSLLAFLLDYPLGQPRLQAHVQFLLANLGYEHESGREAALSMISAVIMKFPEEMVAGWAELIFLPLVTRLVNDPSASCRAAAAACAGQLLNRIPVPRRDHVAAYCTQWLKGNDPRLVRASAQALGIIVEVEGADVARRVVEILPAVSAVLRDRADADLAAQEDEEEDMNNGELALDPSSAAPGWQEAYYCLSLLEKLMTATSDGLNLGNQSTATRACWSAACDLLLHRHAWVRKAAGRLVGAGLAAPNVGPYLLSLSISKSIDGGDTNSNSICTTPGSLAMRFFRQLESATADEGMAGQAVKCLVYLSIPMLKGDEDAGRVPPWRAATSTTLKKKQLADSLAAGSGEEDNGHYNNTEKIENEGEEEEEHEIEQQEEDDEAADIDAATEAAEGSLTVNGLIRRMVRLADDKSYVRQLQRGAALRFIAAIASRLGAVKIEPFLPVLLRPLYRITEPGALGNTEEFKILGDEVMAHLRSLVGADVLLAAYNTARETVRRQRGERKRRAAVQTMVDPEAAAKRKIRAAERKKGGKKKAMEEVRRMRSAGIVVKNKKGVPSGGGKFGKSNGSGGRGGGGRKSY
ncbi:hypothetical protein Ndes2526B_g01987 [Nannochloris sp. 'desiccata']